MPQHYKRKTDRATRIPADVLQRAADEVQQGTSIRKAAVSFNIDKVSFFVVQNFNIALNKVDFFGAISFS